MRSEFGPLYAPVDSGMGMGMGMFQDPAAELRAEQVLAKETPIYASLKLGKFHRSIIEDLAAHPDRHYAWFVLGHVAAGKELITKNILYRQLHDPAIQKIISPLRETGQSVDLGLLSTPMANWLGREMGRIKSPIGKFSCEDVEASNDIMNEVLVHRYENSRKPALDIVEGGFFGHPYWPFTTDVLTSAVERARQDPNYIVKATVIVPDKALQQHGMYIRNTIATASSPQEAEAVVNETGVIFDVTLDPKNFVGSWGNDRTVRQHTVYGDKDAVKRRQAIIEHTANRDFRRRHSQYTYYDLQNDPQLWMDTHIARMKYVMQHDIGMDPKDFIIRRNYFRQNVEIPFQRGFGNEYALISAPWLVTD